MMSAVSDRSHPGDAVVRCRDLTKHFRYHEQQPGLAGTVRAFLRRRNRTRVAALSAVAMVVWRIGLRGYQAAGA